MGLVINGRFLTRPVTGVERYGHGSLKAIAAEWPDARILVPRNYEGPDRWNTLRVEEVGRGTGHAWEQVYLPRSVTDGDVLFSPANTGPLRCARQVIVLHDLAYLLHPEWFDGRVAFWYRMMVPRLYSRALGVVAVSGSMRTSLLHYFGGPAHQVAVVPPFHDDEVFGHGPTELRGRPFCLMVGSLDPRKGVDEALNWYASLTAPHFDLLIVGRRHRAFAPLQLNVPPGVHVLTEVYDAQLGTLYRQARALLCTSRYEGFGLPLLEAMALGCPVIARRLPVFEEQFGDAVRYVNMDGPDAISSAFAELDEPLERTRRVAMGKAIAANYTLERTRTALRNVLQPLLAN